MKIEHAGGQGGEPGARLADGLWWGMHAVIRCRAGGWRCGGQQGGRAYLQTSAPRRSGANKTRKGTFRVYVVTLVGSATAISPLPNLRVDRWFGVGRAQH